MNFKRPLNVLTFKDNIHEVIDNGVQAGYNFGWVAIQTPSLNYPQPCMQKNTFDLNIHNFTVHHSTTSAL